MHAPISRTWIKRQIWISCFLLGVGLWFFYDGKIGFPKKNERFLAHKTFVEQNWGDWNEYARSRGWPKKVPERLYKRADILMQYILGTASACGGLWALFLLMQSAKRSMRGDENGFFTESGLRVDYSSIETIDKRKWDSKGIAVVTYKSEGKSARAVIDDYKYTGAEAFLIRAETALNSSQCTAG